jgi:hypothetical protein
MESSLPPKPGVHPRHCKKKKKMPAESQQPGQDKPMPPTVTERGHLSSQLCQQHFLGFSLTDCMSWSLSLSL